MKFKIHNSYGARESYWISVFLGGQWFVSEKSYDHQRSAMRAAKRAGGTEEVK